MNHLCITLRLPRCGMAEIAWNGRRLAYGDMRQPTESQCIHALAWVLGALAWGRGVS